MVLSAFQLCNGCVMLTSPTTRSVSCSCCLLLSCFVLKWYPILQLPALKVFQWVKKIFAAPQAALHFLLLLVRSSEQRQQGCFSILPRELDAGLVKRRSFFEEYTFRWKWSPQLAWKLASLEALLLIIPTPQRFSRNYQVNVIFSAFTPGQEIFPRLDDRRSPATSSCPWRGNWSSQCWSQVCW